MSTNLTAFRANATDSANIATIAAALSASALTARTVSTSDCLRLAVKIAAEHLAKRAAQSKSAE